MLWVATRLRAVDHVRLLVAHGADFEIPDGRRVSPLLWLAREVPELENLAQPKVTPHKVINREGGTFYYPFGSSVEEVQALLERTLRLVGVFIDDAGASKKDVSDKGDSVIAVRV